jgi:hypothetical protein
MRRCHPRKERQVMITTPELPRIPVGLLTSGESALLRAWAEDYGAACAAAERDTAVAEAQHWQELTEARGGKCKCGYYIAAAIRARSNAKPAG